MRASAKRTRVAKLPEERRQDLLDAAVKVFAERGIHSATVEQITGAAGVAKGTFYLYFDSKERLLGALNEHFADEVADRAERVREQMGRGDWWGLVDALVESMIRFQLEHHEVHDVLVQHAHTSELAQAFVGSERKIIRVLAEVIESGMEAGAFRVSDPLSTAALLLHAVHGAIGHMLSHDARWDRDCLLLATKELFRKALAP